MSQTHPATPAVDHLVSEGAMAGAVGLVWRDGAVTGELVSGWRDLEAKAPMRRDSIFRIASLTKPVTCVAALTLLDEGRFELDDPITRWAPEFARMRVLRDADGPLDAADPAERPITFGDLMTHRSGLTYGPFHAGPIRAAYREALGVDFDSHLTPDAWIAALAGLPLIEQPGAGFHYGSSIDLLGLLIARIEDKPLEDVFRERLFDRLGMADTSFTVPAAKAGRVAKFYGFDADGRLEARASHPLVEPGFLAERPPETSFCSAGAGLWSTADDYLKFARLFVEEGAVDGVRVLKVGTLRRMTANFLTDAQIAAATMSGLPVLTGQGFGLGVAVVLDPDKADVMRCKGGVGTVGWPGAYGGWWQADPTDGSVMVFLAHNGLDLDRIGAGLGVYGAIAAFHAAETAGLKRS